MRLPLGLTLLAIAAASTAGCTTDPEPDESGDGAGDAAPAAFEPWARKFGGTLSPTSMASGLDGDIYLGGTFQGTASFGGGWLDAPDYGTLFVAHLDPQGDHVMSGSTGAEDELRSVAVSSGGAMYVSGDFHGSVNFGTGKLTGENDGYLAGFNPSGTSAFGLAISGVAQVYVDGVVTLPNGNVVIAARADDKTDFGGGVPLNGNGQAQMVVAVYSPSGSHLWEQRTIGYMNEALSLAADAGGNILVGGASYQEVTIGDTALGYAAFVEKLSSDGDVVWVRGTTTESGYIPQIHDLAVDEAGAVYLTGYYYYDPFSIGGIKVPPSQTQNGYLVKLSPEGTGIYAKGFPADNYQRNMLVAAAKGGDVLVGMTSYYPVDFGGGPVGLVTKTSVLMARFDAKGNHVRSMALDGNSSEWLVDLAADPAGNAVIVGTFDNLLDIGEDRLVASGGPDMFIARMAF